MIGRCGVVVSLVATFLWRIVTSGLATAYLIIRPDARPVPTLVRMRFEGLDETGAALLGCMITLTPGTTTIDIDMRRGEMLLHLLDGADPDGAVAAVREDFERPLRRLFPARPEAA